MESTEYANAYSEVLEILKNISKEDYNKIPIEKINLFNTKANKEYKFQYNPTLTLDEQKVSKRAKAIIAILFRDYWATPEQKERIVSKQNYDRARIENDKRNKYNPNDIFKNRVKEKTADESNLPIEVKKNNFLKKIIDYVRNLFIYK